MTDKLMIKMANPRRPRRKLPRNDRYGWSFISLAVVILALFMLYPIVSSFIMSLYAPRQGFQPKFVYFSNYLRLFKDQVFLQALENTLIFFIIQVPIMLLLALCLAALLNNKAIKLRGLFRVGIFLPAVTSLVTYSTLFKMMFSLDGLINKFLLKIHLISSPIPWLSDPFWAKVTVMIAMTWRWTGYNMIFYLSGMQNIPDELYESATIDGANSFHQFSKITVPLLKPIILFTAITSTIGTLQLFDEPTNFASGGVTAATIGPGNSLLTIAVYIYNLCFKYMPNYWYAATVSYAIVIIVAILSFVQFKLAGERQ